MASKVEIVNMALTHISASAIADLDEGSREASLAKTFYEQVKAELLRIRRWNFSTASAELAALSNFSDIASRWSYAYALPADCLKALRVYPEASREHPTEFEIRSRNLLCNVASAKLLYTADITDSTKFDALFVSAFVFRLAAQLSISLTLDGKVQQNMWSLAQQALAEAAAADAGERGIRHPQTLIESRR